MGERVAEAVERYRAAAARGVEWLMGHQHDDGSIGPPEVLADVYHKAGYALGITGHGDRAHRLIDWIVTHDLQPDGDLRHFDQGLSLYKTSWACQAAHRLARFDLSYPVMEFIATRQAPCGGFYHNRDEERYVEPVCSAWGALTAVYHGRVEAAARTVSCCRTLLDQQPEPRRFYTRLTPAGELIREGELVAFLDGDQERQAYYCPGIAMLFLARYHLATGSQEALDTAMGLFEATGRLAGDAFRYVTAAKGGVATAILYRLTGERRCLEAALSLGDYLAAEQTGEGWWCNPYHDGIIVRLDHTAEFIVFLSEIAANLAGASG